MRRFCSKILGEIPPLTTSKTIGTFILGLTAGSLGSLVGLGGAFVTLPILSGPLGLTAHHSIGTSVAATISTSIGASLSFSSNYNNNNNNNNENNEGQIIKDEPTLFNLIPIQRGNVHIIASIFIVTSSSICAIIGARFSKKVRDIIIRRSQGIFMMCIAPVIIARDYLPQINNTISSIISSNNTSNNTSNIITLGKTDENKLDPTELSTYLTPSFGGKLAGIGIISGFLAGFFGVGGGAVVVPALVLVMDFDYKTALGTSMAAMVPTALSSGLVHYRQSTMVVSYSIPLGLGCIIGSYIGAKYVKQINEKELKQFFSITMFVLGLRTLLKAIK